MATSSFGIGFSNFIPNAQKAPKMQTAMAVCITNAILVQSYRYPPNIGPKIKVVNTNPVDNPITVARDSGADASEINAFIAGPIKPKPIPPIDAAIMS